MMNANLGRRFQRLVPQLLVVAVAACLALPGAAGANPAGDSLGDVRQRLDDILAGLKKQTSLSKSQLTALRRDLASISFDLGTIQDDVNDSYRQRGGGHGDDQGDGPGHDWNGHDDHPNWPGDHGPVQGVGWDDYVKANLVTSPAYASFDGWKANHRFDVQFVKNKPVVTITNGTYRAEWTINDAALKSSEISIKQQGDSDIVLDFRDGSNLNQLLIKNGGLGPIYIRQGNVKQVPPPPPPPAPVPNPMAWLQPYDDLVQAHQLDRSPGMDWFAHQVATDRYDAAGLTELGRYVRNRLPAQPGEDIGTLQYVSSKIPRQLSIPDPRGNVSGFVYAMTKAYDLYNSHKNFTVTLK